MLIVRGDPRRPDGFNVEKIGREWQGHQSRRWLSGLVPYSAQWQYTHPRTNFEAGFLDIREKANAEQPVYGKNSTRSSLSRHFRVVCAL